MGQSLGTLCFCSLQGRNGLGFADLQNQQHTQHQSADSQGNQEGKPTGKSQSRFHTLSGKALDHSGQKRHFIQCGRNRTAAEDVRKKRDLAQFLHNRGMFEHIQQIHGRQQHVQGEDACPKGLNNAAENHIALETSLPFHEPIPELPCSGRGHFFGRFKHKPYSSLSFSRQTA